MKRKILIIILIFSIIFTFIGGCNKDKEIIDDNTVDKYITDVDSITDGDYTIELKGLGENTITVSKLDIFNLAIGDNKIIYDKENPVSPSDKQDPVTLGKVKRTATGVKLSLILNFLGKNLNDYSSISVDGLDGYKIMIPSEAFNTSKGGSELIIAYIYEGEVLTSSSKSGALRIVAPDQINNIWAKSIKILTFNSENKIQPNPVNIVFMENLMSYNGAYDVLEDDGNTYERRGISIQKLIDNNIIKMTELDNIYARAYDLIVDANLSSQYYKKRDFYYDYSDIHNSFIIFKYIQKNILNATERDEYNAPSLEGGGLMTAMKMKNLIYISTSTDCIASLNQCFINIKHTSDENGTYIDFYDFLAELNMDVNASYRVYDDNNNFNDLIKADCKSIKVLLKNGIYYIEIIDNTDFKTLVQLNKINKIVN